MVNKPNLFSKLFRSVKDNKKREQIHQKAPVRKQQTTAIKQDSKSQKSKERVKMPLSGSKVEMYLNCPRKFYYSQVKKVKIPSAPSPHLAFDKALHNSLRDFYKFKKKHEPFLLNNLFELLEKHWDSRAFESQEQELEFKNLAEASLKHYFETFCAVPPRNIEVDYFFKVDLHGGIYSGKIDRIDRHPDGSLEVIDYKSGKQPYNGVEDLQQSLSVQLIFVAADRIWPGKVKKITFVYLKDGKTLSVLRDNNELAMAEKKYLDTGESIYKGHFEPVRSSLCNYCDYQQICPVGRVPALNASKIRTFLDCPHKYEAIYVKRVKTSSFDELSFDLVLDRPLHDALAVFHRDYQPSFNVTPQSVLFSEFFRAIPLSIPDEMIDELKNAGRQYLDNYLKSFFPKSKTWLVNEFIEYTTEQFCFQTTIDRVDKHENEVIELIDYKSGKKLPSKSELANEPMTAAVCAAANNQWPGKVSSITFIFLRHNASVSINVDKAIIGKGEHILASIGEQIQQKNFEPLGGPACATCSVAEGCTEKRITASMSKIQTIRDCPKKYEFKYIKKTPAPEGEKPALVLYQLLQTIMYEYIASGVWQSPEKLLSKAAGILDLQPELSPEAREDVLAKAYKAFVNVNKSLEKGFPKIVSLGEQARCGYEELVLTARFDRIERLPNGNLHVVIYKTSKKSLSEHEARIDISGTYNWFVADKLYPSRVEKLSYFYLLTGDFITFTPSTQDVEKLKLTFSEFILENSTAEFEGHRNPLCSYCDYVQQCEDATSMLLSPSKINCFQSCALKYQMKYIQRVPKESRPTPNLSFDRSIHFALREFHENYNLKDFSANPFRSLLNKYWIKDGYSDHEEEERFKVRANKMLEDYYNGLTGEENPVMFETSARWNWNNTDTVVQVDRIDKLANGKLEIIDYKTGKKVPDERVINEDPTLINMFMAANQKWPGQIEKVSYHYLSNNRRYSLSPSEQDIQDHKVRMNSLVEQINKNEFEPNKGALCAWCEFYGPCPEWKVKPHEMVGETQEQFRQRIRLSYSKMSLYLNCPRSYKKLYIDKAPPKPQPFFSFGTTIHETFEEVYDPINPMPKPSLEKVLDIFEKVRLRHREGYANDEIEEKYRQDGIVQVTKYYNTYIKDCDFKPAFSIEDYFEIPCGKYAVMTGFIDRIDKLEDGTYEILDYKTEPTMRSQEAVDNDKQLSIYYWACEDTLGLKISKLSLLMLDFDVKLETTRTRDSIPKVIETIDKTAYEMINEKEFAPRKNKYCKSCDHLHDCPLKDEILKDESLISMKKF